MDTLALLVTASSYIAYHGFIGYLAVFLGAFLETIPFTGLFVPANIIMTLAGAFSYAGYLKVGAVLSLAAAGGMLGDLLGYWLGKKYNHNWENKPLAKKRAYFEKTEIFLKAHGVKSIFIARFIGPLRPFIAFIAGASKMHFSKFVFFSFISAIAWAASFFTLGYALGESMETIVLWIEKMDTIMFIAAAALPAAFTAYWFLFPNIKARTIPPATEK